MKKLFTLVALSLLLTSCGRMTSQEIEDGKKYCESAGKTFDLSQYGGGDNFYCRDKQDKVRTCIRDYVDTIDEKYNNPDSVSNLREDNYSQVVKTCNETFGSLSGSVKK